jgi:hypothetical protein
VQSGIKQFDPNSWLGADLRAKRYPCSALVSVWLLAVQGYNRKTWDGWRSIDPFLWDSVNIRGNTKKIDYFGGIVAAASVMGSGYTIKTISETNKAPPLTPTSWHYIQRWKRSRINPLTYDHGHAYLVWYDNGVATVHQSTTNEGYTVGVGSWEGSAGLAGYDVGICHIPNVPK